MGVRPPTDDTDEPDIVEFGIAALDEPLSRADISYPATAEEVTATVGDEAVPYDARGHTVELGEAVAELDQPTFEDEQSLKNALHPVFEARRTGSSAGLLQQVRSMMPF
ncbi:hypothetical protein BRD17_00310 [Halobacteriales archaeon SW_7_68_16]|nr:MAG: hypothetical protein BRD17_00310 [Halobacteriales archaeon SW_7_68_16]